MAISNITGDLGRPTAFNSVTELKNDWPIDAQNQRVGIFGITYNGSQTDYLATEPVSNLSLLTDGDPGWKTYGNKDGIGVRSVYDGWFTDVKKVRAEINYDPNTNRSEVLKFVWAPNQTVQSAFIDLSLFVPKIAEKFGDEVGFLQPFKDGQAVSFTNVFRMVNETTPSGSQTSINNAANGVTFTADDGVNGDFKFKVFGNFDELRFSAKPYANPSSPQPTSRNSLGQTVISDSSDYLVQQLKYTGIEDSSVLQFSNPIFSVNEDGTPVAAVTVTRTGGLEGTASATINLTNGTATAPGDYSNNPIAVTFAPGETSKTITVPVVDDTLVEGDETVNLSLTNPSAGTTLGTQSTATLNIIDNDTPGTLQFSNPQYVVGEDGIPVLAVTVTRTGGSAGAVSATVVPSDGTAIAPGDYANNPITVSFADGDTTPKIVTIPIVDDTLVEPDETVNLALTNPTGGATLGTQTTAELTILDNDVPLIKPVAFVASLDPTAGEPGRADGDATFQFARTGGDINQPLTIRYTVTGTAIPGVDYTGLTNFGTVTIAAGQSVSAPVSITPLTDSINEPVESVVVKVAEDPAYQVGSADTGIARLLDFNPLTGTNPGAGAVLRYNSAGVFQAGYTNITNAVTAAAANDILVAQAGLYNEPGTVVINKPLTLRGPNAGVSPGTGSTVSPAIVFTGAGQPVFTVFPGANNVTIEGLTIQMNGENGIRVQSDTPLNVVVRQNTFSGNGPFNGGTVFLDNNGAAGSSAQFIDNLVRDVSTATGSTTSGVQAFRFDTVRITDNRIANLTGPGIAADAITNPANFIANNNLSNIGEQGIQLAGGNARIENNDITNARNISTDIDRGGIRLRDSGLTATTLGTVDVLSNVITNSFNGVAFRDGTNVTGTVRINNNNLIGNANAGLYHGGSGTVDATNNWWDDVTGPVVGGTGRNAIAGAGAGSVNASPFSTTPL